MANVISSVVSIVVTSFCGYLVWWLQKHSNNRDAERDGIKLLLRSTMKQYYNEYKDNGKISSSDYTEFEEMYNAYHNLGGNGTATKWFNKIKELEIDD